MSTVQSNTLYGNLNLLILKAVAAEPLHGLAIARRIRSASEDVLAIEEGALYPALHRLERDGHLRGSWGTSEQNRRAKFYELTASGRQLLSREVKNWVRHTTAVAKVLELAEQ
jgi:PadR family transcriptional regulator PadR